MSITLFRIKICGVTRAEDAHRAAAAGADAIGLNFHPPSPRFVEPSAARLIVEALPADVAKVGVFVNAPADEVIDVFEQLGLDFIQLHGDEPPEFLARLKPRLDNAAGTLRVPSTEAAQGVCLRQAPIVRAIRLSQSDWTPVAEYVAACRSLSCLPAALLIDAHRPGMYGGTGQTVDWQLLGSRPAELAEMPVILAGGLDSLNVAEAVRVARPWGVDTASGVETAPGVKDGDKIHQFVAAARGALAELETRS